MSPETLSHRLRPVLGMAPPPVKRTAIFTRLQRKVAEQEQHARQQRAVRVALVSPARSSREGMRVLLEAAGAHVAVAAPEMPLVRHALTQFRVSVLIAAASEWRAALDLAREARVPLLLVAATADEALTIASLARPEQQQMPPVSIIFDDDLVQNQQARSGIPHPRRCGGTPSPKLGEGAGGRGPMRRDAQKPCLIMH